jgi:hypothetical protein
MSGVEMMMKSFGIDPEKIKAELGGILKTTTDNVMREVTAIKESQLRIETKVDLILGVMNPQPEKEAEPENKLLTEYSGQLDSVN